MPFEYWYRGTLAQPLDTSTWDIHVLTWRIVYLDLPRPGIFMMPTEVKLVFPRELTLAEKTALDSFMALPDAGILPPYAYRIDITWDVEKILADAKAAGYKVMYFGTTKADGNVKASFISFDSLTLTDKNKILNYAKSLFVVE